ncbi:MULTISPECIES: ABC transporter permease [unclassified Paenibacillus]|uniref:ABC transporter permease n=1 Tax=unclassified Paenibacillus TaxID=185978 RepID=UPI001C11CE1A|nr:MULTISPECIES: ABC transporter permease [unclassified Paenibacillus]MBU5440867.1 ABC transporter permease [Paenibacillus sp. MSJ-34]CAH0118433.1 Riboflavin transport system permease protein RibX [Paenibacillus sp. CECT 9249]
MKVKHWVRQGWPPLAVILVLLIGWQTAVTVGHIEAWLLPGPLQIVEVFGNADVAARLWSHTFATARIALLGFGAGAVFGVVLAISLHLIPGMRAAVYPLLVLSQNIPVITTGPLLVMWLGYGLLPKVILIMLVCFFPVIVATLTGLTQPDPHLLNYMRMIGARKWQIMRKLEFPSALPHLFSGLRIAASYSVLTAVVAEWIGAKEGLGIFIRLSANGYMTDRVFASIFVIVALSLLLFALVVTLERCVIRWQRDTRTGSKGGR